MDKSEISQLLKKIKRRYQNFQLPLELVQSKAMIDEWFEDMQDVPFEVATENLRKHAAGNDWPPSIAKLSKPLVDPEEERHAELKEETEKYFQELEKWPETAVGPPDHFKERMRQLAARRTP